MGFLQKVDILQRFNFKRKEMVEPIVMQAVRLKNVTVYTSCTKAKLPHVHESANDMRN